MNREYIVFSQRLCATLMLEGFALKRMEKTNKEDKWRNIFVFNNSEKLMTYIEKYKK